MDSEQRSEEVSESASSDARLERDLARMDAMDKQAAKDEADLREQAKTDPEIARLIEDAETRHARETR